MLQCWPEVDLKGPERVNSGWGVALAYGFGAGRVEAAMDDFGAGRVEAMIKIFGSTWGNS